MLSLGSCLGPSVLSEQWKVTKTQSKAPKCTDHLAQAQQGFLSLRLTHWAGSLLVMGLSWAVWVTLAASLPAIPPWLWDQGFWGTGLEPSFWGLLIDIFQMKATLIRRYLEHYRVLLPAGRTGREQLASRSTTREWEDEPKMPFIARVTPKGSLSHWESGEAEDSREDTVIIGHGRCDHRRWKMTWTS